MMPVRRRFRRMGFAAAAPLPDWPGVRRSFHIRQHCLGVQPLSLVRRTVAAVIVATLAATGVVAPLNPRPGPPAVAGHRVSVAAAALPTGFTTAVHPGYAFESVGFQWPGTVHGSVDVRALVAGRWTPWQQVEANPSEGPDQRSHEHRPITAAGPVWVGRGATDVQVRVDRGPLPGLQLYAIHSAASAPSSWSTWGAGRAAASPAEPGIITRAGWGADESWRNQAAGCQSDPSPDYAPAVRNAIVHHTDNANNYGPADSAAMIRAIYYFHVFVNGWCDLGYNFLVDRYGQVFEGRYGGVTSAVIGAHAGGFNSGSTGVALVGEFQDTEVPRPMYDALVSLLAWKLAYHGIQPTGQLTVVAGSFDQSLYQPGAAVDIWTVSGHRDLDSTDCPGDLAYGLLGALRFDVQRTMAASPPPVDPAKGGLDLVATDGGMFTFGAAGFYGSTGGLPLVKPVVAMAATPSGHGYWLVASDGGIFTFGDARFYGSTGGLALVKPVVAMAATPTGHGYWLVASDGGIFSFGDARFYGSTGGLRLNQPVVGMAATPTGHGYWLVASDGGIFSFGDAAFYGSAGGWHLNQPIVSMARTRSGRGYRFVARDGGVFSFGDAAFYGSAGGMPLPHPVVGLATTATGAGYDLVDSGGDVYGFGDAPWLGSTANIDLNRPITGLAAIPPPPPPPSPPTPPTPPTTLLPIPLIGH